MPKGFSYLLLTSTALKSLSIKPRAPAVLESGSLNPRAPEDVPRGAAEMPGRRRRPRGPAGASDKWWFGDSSCRDRRLSAGRGRAPSPACRPVIITESESAISRRVAGRRGLGTRVPAAGAAGDDSALLAPASPGGALTTPQAPRPGAGRTPPGRRSAAARPTASPGGGLPLPGQSMEAGRRRWEGGRVCSRGPRAASEGDSLAAAGTNKKRGLRKIVSRTAESVAAGHQVQTEVKGDWRLTDARAQRESCPIGPPPCRVTSHQQQGFLVMI